MIGNEFLSVAASTRVSDVVELLADASLHSVIVHDEDEDDFYVVPATDVTSSAEAGTGTMGSLLSGMALDPVDALEIGPVVEAAMLPAHRAQRATVLLADGVVLDVLGGTTVRGDGGGGESDGGDDGEPGPGSLWRSPSSTVTRWLSATRSRSSSH